MSVDIPRAWEITRSVAPERHHVLCSFSVALMLCDCDVLMKHPEQLDATFYGAGGRVIRAADEQANSHGAGECTLSGKCDCIGTCKHGRNQHGAGMDHG